MKTLEMMNSILIIHDYAKPGSLVKKIAMETKFGMHLSNIKENK